MIDGIKGYKGVVKEGDEVYMILAVNDDGARVLGVPLSMETSLKAALRAMHSLSEKIDDRIVLYKATKMGAASHVEYEEYIQSRVWKLRAKEAKERVGGRCQVCNSNGQVDAHHRTYERLGDERPEDITVLCRECHTLFHENGKLKR